MRTGNDVNNIKLSIVNFCSIIKFLLSFFSNLSKVSEAPVKK